MTVIKIKKRRGFASPLPFSDPAFMAISIVYGDDRSERTNVPYIKHILDGLLILDHLGASKIEMQAWCLHPIFQIKELRDRAESINVTLTAPIGSSVLAAAYADAANSFTSMSAFTGAADRPPVIPSASLHKLLVADKIQNYCEFADSIDNFEPKDVVRLNRYFKLWLEHLGLSTGIARAMYSDIVLNADKA